MKSKKQIKKESIRKRWKECERRVAERVGSKREGATGTRGFDVIASDDYTWDHVKLGIEVKYRQSVPQWFVDYIKQAIEHEIHCFKEGELMDGVVVLSPMNCKVDDMTVFMRFGDFLDMRKRLCELENKKHWGYDKVGGTDPD